MAEQVVHFMLSARDPGRLGRFYEELLSWRIRVGRLTSLEAEASGSLRLVDTGGEISGSITGPGEPRGVALVVQVDDLESVLANAERLGATRSWRESFELADAGARDARFELAEIVDPEGNRVGLLAAKG